MDLLKKLSEGSIYDTLFVAALGREISGRARTENVLTDPYDATQTKQVTSRRDNRLDLTRIKLS